MNASSVLSPLRAVAGTLLLFPAPFILTWALSSASRAAAMDGSVVIWIFVLALATGAIGLLVLPVTDRARGWMACFLAPVGGVALIFWNLMVACTFGECL